MNLLPTMEGLHAAEAFNPAFLEAFFRLVGRLEDEPEAHAEALRGKIVASVFLEPSTRTRLSFEAAAHRLGASVLTVADAKSSSARKGESLADTARMLGSYADLVVLRHARDGASRHFARYAGVPVVNGGDGRIGHPSQTLVDLYTLFRAWGSFRGRTLGLMGDLMHGRTARSLAWACAALGLRLVLLPGAGLDWESSFEQRLLDRFDFRLRWAKHPLFTAWTGSAEARVLEPKDLVQKVLFGQDRIDLGAIDALYLTRLQDERGAVSAGDSYPGVTPEQMEDGLLRDCLLLHPLPRRDELPTSLDQDPRMLAFQQAACGPVVRQALFLALLGREREGLPPLTPLPVGREEEGMAPCPNANCVSRAEGLPTSWRVVGQTRRSFLCASCDTLLPVDYAGCASTRRVHPLHSQAVLRIRPENLRPFRAREEALEQGFSWGG